MSLTKQQLQADLTESMRARDEVRTGSLRMLLTAVANEEVAGSSARELSSEELVVLVRRELKKRREAAEAFDAGGRTDRAERERAEAEVLAAYLPAELDDAALTALVADAIAESGAAGPSAMGQVMKVVQPKVAGRAEGGRVAAEVKRQLAAG